MIAFLILFLHVLVSPFKTRARLEAEIALLRHQLNRPASAGSFEAETDGRRPIGLCLALSPVSGGVERRHDCPTGNRYSMASV